MYTLGEPSGCREAVWAAVCDCGQEGPVGASSLEREDTALPGRGGGGSGVWRPRMEAVLSVGAAHGPRLSSGFCAECWGSHWKQAGLIP